MMYLAYLDAGSGSLIVQAVVGGTAGAAVAAKLYWRRVAARFRRQPTEPAEASPSLRADSRTGSPATGPAPTDPAPTGRQPRQPAGN
ncbi:hypothetical protein [Micromonospora wenchangensis]|uniref:hypothetical protein n=1 Tax=Micromonospora wenchangensis TaxID=1185415 RepID=UPI003830DEDF